MSAAGDSQADTARMSDAAGSEGDSQSVMASSTAEAYSQSVMDFCPIDTNSALSIVQNKLVKVWR